MENPYQINLKMYIQIPCVGGTPLLQLRNLFGISNLFVKDESVNPTHTFKDRLANEMLKPIFKSIKNGEKTEKTSFASISYGNTAMSLGYYCKQLNDQIGKELVNAIAFMPPSLKHKVFGPDTTGRFINASDVLQRISENCKIIEIDLNKKIYNDKTLEEIARSSGYCFEKYIDVTEGLDRPAYKNIILEVIEYQLKDVPDYIIVPFGAGILCNEIIDYVNDRNLQTKVIPVSSGYSDTIAVMLYGPMWVYVDGLLKNGKSLSVQNQLDKKGRTRMPYYVYHIYDDEILCAINILKEKNISCEPSAASGFAILPRLKQISPEFNPSKHSVLVINTGNSFLNV